MASASIGQVHKAVWADGREVAVKIQYPGADEALRADLKTMQRMVSVLKQLSPGADVQGVVDELIERTEMELDYRLEADNQRAFAKAYEGDPDFVVPRVVASAPKVVIQEWIEGIPLSQIIREGTQEQRDLMATRLFVLLQRRADAVSEMVHGDAHPGNFMLMPDNKMGVIDFGAVAPMPGGWPVELGQMLRYAVDKNYDKLLPTMEKVGFIQKGQQVSTREIDDMLKQYVEPLQVPVFHYTRKWLQRMTTLDLDKAAGQIRAARQMDIPPKLAIPMRVIASIVAISCQLDAHVPVRRIADETGSRLRRPRRRLATPGSGRSVTRLHRLSRVLARPAPRALARDDRAALEDLAAPNAPRLLPFQRRGQALAPDRAFCAQRLGALEIARVLGEPQVGVLDMTRHRQLRALTCQGRHVRSSASWSFFVGLVCLSMDL